MPVKGLDAVRKKLKKLTDIKQVSFGELFNPSFMASNTDFANIQEMFDQSGFKVESQEDLAAIPDDQWDDFVTARTRFASWADMQKAAFELFMKKALR